MDPYKIKWKRQAVIIHDNYVPPERPEPTTRQREKARRMYKSVARMQEQGHVGQPGELELYFDRSRTSNYRERHPEAVGQSDDYAYVEVHAQGNRMTVHRPIAGGRLRNPSSGGPRGVVSRFSEQSRKRLIDLFASFDRRTAKRGPTVLFVTLTYPENITDGRKAKRDLKVYMERLQERWPELWCVWRMEFQERGAIHFHLMLGGVGYLPLHKPDGWCAQRAWNEVTGQDAPNSLDVERLRSLNGVMWYVAKYMTKQQGEPDNGPENGSEGEIEPTDEIPRGSLGLSIPHIFSEPSPSVGRFWGVYGRKNLPLAAEERYSVVLTRQEFMWWLAKVDSPYCAKRRGFTVFTENAHALGHAIATLMERSGDSVRRWEMLDRVTKFNRWQTIAWWALTAEQQVAYLYSQIDYRVFGAWG